MPVKVTVRKTAESTGLFPEGLNRAILVEVEEHDTKKNSSVRLTFANGDFEHKEDLWLSSAAQKRLTLISKRLGLIDDRGGDEQEVLFDNAVGNEYVLDIKHEKDQQDCLISKLTYAGLWPLTHDDEKVKAYLQTAEGKRGASAEEREPGGAGDDDLNDV